MDIRKLLVAFLAFFSLFLAYAPQASAAITTCPGRPNVTLNWNSSGCTTGPTISSSAFACNVGGVAASGNTSISNGTSCTATINCSNSGGSATPVSDSINYRADLTWDAGSQTCVTPACPNGANNPPTCNSCPAGTVWNGSSCVVPVNGSCNATHYNCNAGTPANQAQGATSYTWTCQGSNGGSNASCSEAVPGAPSCTSVAPSAATAYGTSGTFRLYAYGVVNATSVYFPTWSEVNGQNDLVWYPGTNAGGGTWYADVNLGNHVAGAPEYGTFDTHVYMNSASYSNVWCNAMTWQRQADTPSCTGGAPQSAQTLATSGTFRVYAYGVSSNTTSMWFPTWGLPNGQNDLVWYPGTNAGGGTWYADVNLGNHVAGAPEYGTFETDVYMNSASQSNVGCIGYQWTRGYNNAACVSLSAPTSVVAGQTFSATVVMNNNGTTNWTQADQYKLGSQPQDNQIWGLSRILMPATVTPGNNATFTFNATAPATTGTYPFGWAMLEEGVQWFGTTCTQNITVGNCPNGANNPPSCSQCPAGYAYINGTCTACANGGCSGGGGSSGNPLGSLTCNNGATNPTACSNLIPTAALSGNPTTIVTGQAATLSWSSTNATSCVAAGGATWMGSTNTSGSANVSPSSTSSYQITCSNASNSANSNIVTITVVQPTASISATPSRVHAGQTSTIAWSAANVTGCTVSGPGLSASGTSGSRSVTVNSQAVYTLNCTTSGSPLAPRTTTVNIIPDFQEF